MEAFLPQRNFHALARPQVRLSISLGFHRTKDTCITETTQLVRISSTSRLYEALNMGSIDATRWETRGISVL